MIGGIAHMIKSVKFMNRKGQIVKFKLFSPEDRHIAENTLVTACPGGGMSYGLNFAAEGKSAAAVTANPFDITALTQPQTDIDQKQVIRIIDIGPAYETFEGFLKRTSAK
jgi:hypothetical protein